MGLFGKKKEIKKDTDTVVAPISEVVEKKDVSKTKDTSVPQDLVLDRNLSAIIARPRITEKAMLGTDKNVYTFEVLQGATKHDVRDAIKELYKVTPLKINIVNKKPRTYISRMRGRTREEKGLRKAYVYLKEGDRIDLV